MFNNLYWCLDGFYCVCWEIKKIKGERPSLKCTGHYQMTVTLFSFLISVLKPSTDIHTHPVFFFKNTEKVFVWMFKKNLFFTWTNSVKLFHPKWLVNLINIKKYIKLYLVYLTIIKPVPKIYFESNSNVVCYRISDIWGFSSDVQSTIFPWYWHDTGTGCILVPSLTK